MATYKYSPAANIPQFFNNDGTPLSGGKISTYQSGSFTTRQTTYTSSSGAVPNDNPLTLDSSGRSNTEFWLDENQIYNFVVTLPDGTTILWQQDNVVGAVTGTGQPVLPDTLVGFGSSTNQLTSNSNFNYNSSAGILNIGATTNGEINCSSSLTLKTNNQSRLSINSSGAFTINSSTGVAGQILTSQDSSAPPQWQNPVFKPMPYVTVTSAVTAVDIGSASQHWVHYRATGSTTQTLTIQPDTHFTGSEVYWQENFSPSTPGPMPIGGTIIVGKLGTGNVVFAAGSGVTINTASLTLSTQYTQVTLVKTDVNTWDIF